MKTKVVHLRKEHWDVRITRGTPWGNPYIIVDHHSREDAIEHFELYVRQDPELMKRIKAELRGKVLGCWCKPKPCHGDVLARIAEE